MASFNQVILMGNLGNDPEMRYVGTGTQVCDFRIAVNKQWTTQEGEKREITKWFKVVVWRKQAELVAQYLTKGKSVQVIGELEEAEAYINKDGKAVAVSVITAQHVIFLGGASPAADGGEKRESQGRLVEDEGDIPF